MSWKNILKNDVEKIKQNFINHFNLQGADIGKVLEAVSGMKRDDMIEILEVSGLDVNDISSRGPFMQAVQEIKGGKLPSRQAAPKPPAPKPPAPKPAHAVIPDTHRDKPKKDPKETPNPAIIPDTHRNKGIPWRK